MEFFNKINIYLSFLGLSTGYLFKKSYDFIIKKIQQKKKKENYQEKFINSTIKKEEKQDEEIKNIKDHTQQISNAQSDIIRRQKAILYNQIRVKSKNLINQGYITLSDLDALNLLYKEYKEIGGNGTAEILYKKAISLPKKGDSEHVQ